MDLEHNYGDVLRDAFYYNKIIDIKPYLRPMSSMTEEEKDTLRKLWQDAQRKPELSIKSPEELAEYIRISSTVEIDFYNEYKLDYRNLISKGLALPALDGMYND